MENVQFEVKELQERQVAFVSFIGNYVGNTQVFANLFNQLGGWAGPKGLMGPDTVFLSAYYDDPNVTPSDELKLDACMSIPEDTLVEGDIKKQVLPGGKYAVMHAELTSQEEYGPAWERAVEWIEENDFELDLSRPCYEVYLNNPEEHPKKYNIIDICMSVIEKSRGV